MWTSGESRSAVAPADDSKDVIFAGETTIDGPPKLSGDTVTATPAAPIEPAIQEVLSSGMFDNANVSTDPEIHIDPLIEAIAETRGIRSETLIENRIRPYREDGATGGFLIPYWYLDPMGNRRVTEDPPGKHYCRRRHGDRTHCDHKYSQEKGTGPHIYTPVGVEDLLLGESPFRTHDNVQRLLIQEGEMKALSVVEAGFPSVGLGGITCYMDKQGALHPELTSIIWAGGVEEVIFIGDTDAAINARFAQAACSIANLIKLAGLNCVLRVFTMPFSGHPKCKGIDDWRRELNDDCRFSEELLKLVDEAIKVEASL